MAMLTSRIYYLLSLIFLIEVGVSFGLLGLETGQKGPFRWDIQLKRIENCKDQGSKQIDMDLRLKKVSRTRVDLEGNITFKLDFADNIKVPAVNDFSTWGNGGWRSNAYRCTMKRACSDASVYETLLKEIRRKSGMPYSCPVPKGTYELKSLDTRIINNITIPFYTIPTLWKMNFAYYDKSDNKLLGCKLFIVESRVRQ